LTKITIRIAAITSRLILTTLSLTASAAMNTPFSQCAQAALESKSLSIGQINVELPSNYSNDMDREPASDTQLFKMILSIKNGS